MRITDSIGDMFHRLKPLPKAPAAKRRAEKSEVLNPALGGKSGTVANAKVQEERDRLAREFVIQQWDLGGLAYEMARRDHFRLDLLAKQAAKLQQTDSSLGQAERLLRMEDEGIAGTCSSCGALQARGAAFCWQCGTELVASAPVGGGVQAPPPAVQPPSMPPQAAAPPAAADAPTQPLAAAPHASPVETENVAR